ncbi:hypothetical protein DSL64_22155 [Dyadobacter luteus]|uniref:Uncharacterized protein n=1 Tax=Dyadobacter luteus TaxID=2259619 RepID=A0A3D8Y609_9BACT|nr:hypothetical protein [Dyadobacter luteus]REA58089.1 hypothetical protein DSL64_22155 [Dyadobacter luteus]
MNTPEENPDDQLGRHLRERFDDFAPEVDESVRRNIFGSSAGISTFYYWGAAIVIVLMGLLYVPENLKSGGHREKVFSLSEKKESVRGKGQDSVSSNDIRSKTENGQSVSTPTRSNFSANSNPEFPSKKMETGPVNPSLTVVQPVSRILVPENEQINKTGSGVPAAIFNESTTVETKSEELSKQTELHLLDGRDIFFEKINLTSVIGIPEVDSMTPSVKNYSTSPTEWIFSMAALPTFQIVHLNSLPELSYQNVKFAPALSARSISYKISAGIEKRKFQLLLSYGYLRNWNTYEIGSSRIKVDRQDDQGYTALPIGELHKIDEKLHLLGLSVRRTLLLPDNFAKLNRATLGAEYTRVWPTGQNMYWANAGIARQIVDTQHSRIQIGPYAQYSFSKRSVGAHTWKSQPYQVGLSVEVRFK